MATEFYINMLLFFLLEFLKVQEKIRSVQAICWITTWGNCGKNGLLDFHFPLKTTSLALALRNLGRTWKTGIYWTWQPLIGTVCREYCGKVFMELICESDKLPKTTCLWIFCSPFCISINSNVHSYIYFYFNKHNPNWSITYIKKVNVKTSPTSAHKQRLKGIRVKCIYPKIWNMNAGKMTWTMYE